jgi:hypothetical protein
MICYKIYSLVVAIFDFMHTTSMYVVYTLITDSLFYVAKNQTPEPRAQSPVAHVSYEQGFDTPALCISNFP